MCYFSGEPAPARFRTRNRWQSGETHLAAGFEDIMADVLGFDVTRGSESTEFKEEPWRC